MMLSSTESSEVQGFGLYAGEKLSAGDFVGEYKGEVVTKEEGSRRGAVYQHLKTNYLFDLNRAQEVDSTRAGNKLRFINNSAKAPNCEPRVMLCNTVVRIGLFANKDLEPGDEMFFNYNYPEEVTKHFWEKGQAKPSGSATWQDLNDVLGEEDDESFGDSEQDFDSEENGRARKRARKARE
ncbi:putative esc e complex protein [Diplodia seriata]|uniref:Putative esc e complex protein n=1 Tax=Diplodia seriata TaxID=420778 RepID=A0A0G2EWX0_9PEZI|nr:putative esc e complex protein [Diplodia seriata]